MAQPDYTQQFNEIWGWPQEIASEAYPIISIASNIIVGANPPYSYTDFIALYPQFAGVQKGISGTSLASQITGVTDITGLSVGNYIVGNGLDSGTTISSITGSTAPYTIGLSKPALAGSTGTFNVINAPAIPTAIVNAYIAVATASLFQARWFELWPIAMGLYIAHFITLWAQSQTPAGASLQQIVASGLAIGIDISQSAGDVSYTSKLLEFEGWGTFALTLFGQQLITWAQTLGMAGMLLW